MFATLSSFFPSSPFQQVSHSARPPDIPSPSPPSPPAPPAVDLPQKKEKKDRKDKYANEAFIIVRPPPSVSTQPLSLQVQLVPPQSRHDKPLQVLDSSPDDLNTDLRRTHSNGSEGSSYCSSLGSVSSLSSTSTGSSARRMIIPLYNLNVHSVTPTTVLDAGTDAKVAKFAKRGLEVIGLAFLEPIEVRSSVPVHGSLPASISACASFDDSFRDPGSTSGPSPHLSVVPGHPRTSYVTVKSSGGHPRKPIINLTPAPPLPPPDQPPQRSTKKLFASVFKRKDTAAPMPIAVPLPDAIATPQHSPLSTNTHLTVDAPLSQPDASYHHDTRSSATLSNTTTSQTAVLGVYSTLYPPVSNPRGRPTKYVWVVRKWLKGSDASILNGMMGKLNVGTREASPANTPHNNVEVRFEWSRGPKKRNGRKSRPDKSSNPRESPSPSRRPLNNAHPRYAPPTLNPIQRDQRRSIISHHSSGSDTATSLTSSAHPPAQESDEESDPEDSETPWSCSVAVQRLGQIPHHHQDSAQELSVRIKVATLAPTPHHPKVIGFLKMPFPLPDIEVEHLLVRRRVVTGQGISKMTVSNTNEFILTAEEIKDTVSATALWLVVREAFGGVGRERKKGKS